MSEVINDSFSNGGLPRQILSMISPRGRLKYVSFFVGTSLETNGALEEIGLGFNGTGLGLTRLGLGLNAIGLALGLEEKVLGLG